jgi:hypothetical protein
MGIRRNAKPRRGGLAAGQELRPHQEVTARLATHAARRHVGWVGQCLCHWRPLGVQRDSQTVDFAAEAQRASLYEGRPRLSMEMWGHVPRARSMTVAFACALILIVPVLSF